MQIGDVREFDFQADVFRGRYRLVENVGGNAWVVEFLAPDDAELDRIVEHYANAEARGYLTAPVWNKTWAECVGAERPVVVRHKTHAEEMGEELDRRYEMAGQRTTMRFVSADQYAAAF